MEKASIGAALALLRDRSGMSLQATAEAAGYKNGSSVQRFFDSGYDPVVLPLPIGMRLAQAFEGKGSPPITKEEVLALAELPVDSREKEARLTRTRSNLTLALEERFDLLVPLQTDLEGGPSWASCKAHIITQRFKGYKRPPHLVGHGGAAYVVTFETMIPRLNPGDVFLTTSVLPPDIGDYVVVMGRGPGSESADNPVAYLAIGRLAGRTPDQLAIEEYNPSRQVQVPRQEVTALHKILTPTDLLEPAQ